MCMHNTFKSKRDSLFLAQHQGPQHHYGGARPKDKQSKSPGSPGMMKPAAKEQTDEGNSS